MKIIHLSQGHSACVDDQDYDLLSQFNWFAINSRNTVYAYRTTPRPRRRSIQMHRMVMGLKEGNPAHVDHIDNNGLNNQRSNLRICTPRENACKFFRPLPVSGFRGVVRESKTGRWLAHCRHKGKKRFLGAFSTPTEAAAAYDEAVTNLRGDFAVTNKMLGAYQ